MAGREDVIGSTPLLDATTVIIAEDDAAVVRLLENMLPNLGYEIVAVVSSGDEVVQLTRSYRADVILMDIRLRGSMDGVDAAREIRRHTGVPVVFLTGFADTETLNRAKAADPQGYILKPFGLHDLQVGIEIAVSRHRLEQQITESRRWFEATITCIGDGVLACDAGRRVRLANPVFAEMCGWSERELVGQPLTEALRRSGIDNETVEAIVRTRPGQGPDQRLLSEVELVTRNGAFRNLELSASAITDGSGQDAGLVIVARDATDRNAAAQAKLLRRQGDYFRALTENSGDLVLVLDDSRHIRYASPSLTRILGHDTTQTLDRDLGQLVDEPHYAELAASFRDALAQPRHNVECRLDLLHANGHRRSFEVVMRNLLSDSRVEGVVVNAHDITASEAARAAIRHREQAVEAVSFANELLLRSDRSDHVVDDVLVRLGKATNALQITVQRFAQAHVMGDSDAMWTWCSPGVEATLPELLGKIDHETTTAVGSETIVCGHGASAMAFPITNLDRAWGYLCICHPWPEGEWSAVDMETGRAVARALAAGFQRQAAEQHLRMLENAIEHLPMGITITDRNGKIMYTNPAEAEMHGYTVEDLLGGEARMLAPPTLWRQTPLVEKLKDTPRCYETQNLHHDGHLFPVELTSVVVSTEDGVPIGAVTGCQDISERKAVELALKRSEQDYKGLIENAHDAILILAPDSGEILEVNQQACETFDVRREQLVGRTVADITRDATAIEQMIQSTLQLGSFRGLEAIHPKADRSEIVLEINSSLVSYQDRPAILTINRDVTARQQAELELSESREQLRRLAEHLQAAREEERLAVARTVHDELGQTLTALKMDVALVKRRLEKDPQAAAVKLDAMSDHIDTAIETVQQLATTLRPSILDNLGLAAAIEWHVEEFNQRSDIDCKVSLPDDELDVDADIATTLFRILQESLNNVARHSKASQVKITLTATRTAVSLVIRDNGIGIAEAKIDHPDSLGLIGIRERARNFHGEAEITGFPGLGTRVTILLPLHTPHKERA